MQNTDARKTWQLLFHGALDSFTERRRRPFVSSPSTFRPQKDAYFFSPSINYTTSIERRRARNQSRLFFSLPAATRELIATRARTTRPFLYPHIRLQVRAEAVTCYFGLTYVLREREFLRVHVQADACYPAMLRTELIIGGVINPRADTLSHGGESISMLGYLHSPLPPLSFIFSPLEKMEKQEKAARCKK